MNLAAAAWKARTLNEVLPALQEQFETALSEGSILELTTADVSWMETLLEVDA